MNAGIDQNNKPSLIAVSSTDQSVIVPLYADPITHRLLVDSAAGMGTVTSVSVASANGFAGTVATSTTTPTITLSTTITGLLKGNGTAISAASDGTDYLSSTTGVTLAQGTAQTIGTTTNRVLKLWATDITVTNAITGSITGNAGTVTTNANLTGAITSVGNTTSLGSFTSAQLATALTDETGSGSSVFGTLPTISIRDNALNIKASGDITKVLQFDVQNIGTGQMRTATYPGDVDMTLVGTSITQTLTNKRINPRIVSATSYTTDTGTSLNISTCDEFVITAQAGALKFNNPSDTPVEGNKLIIRIKDNGTARALTWDTQFNASTDLPLPTTTVLGKTLFMGFIYNATDTKWTLLALLNNI